MNKNIQELEDFNNPANYPSPGLLIIVLILFGLVLVGVVLLNLFNVF